MFLRTVTTATVLTMLLSPSVAFADNLSHLEKLLSTQTCQQCNLVSAGLVRADLAGAQLQGANLTNANLSRANLTGANLKGANLLDAIFVHTNLQGACLESLTHVSEVRLAKAKTLAQATMDPVLRHHMETHYPGLFKH